MPRLSTEIAQKIQEILIDCAHGDVEVRSYSGKGMYGRSCIGIVGEETACTASIANVIDQFYSDACDAYADADSDDDQLSKADKLRDIASDVTRTLLKTYRVDNMGRTELVYYWPDIPFTSEDEDE